MLEIVMPDTTEETVDELKMEKAAHEREIERHKEEIARIDDELEKRGVRTRVSVFFPERRKREERLAAYAKHPPSV